jgi:hypothetical protein
MRMRTIPLLVILVALAVLASANIPPGLHNIEPTVTLCTDYTATGPAERMDDWLNTLQNGLMSNPELAETVWECVMDTYKVAETDQLVLRACRENVLGTTFKDIVFKALETHLEQCGIAIKR